MVASVADPDVVTSEEIAVAVGAERGTPKYLEAAKTAQPADMSDDRGRPLYFFFPPSNEPANST